MRSKLSIQNSVTRGSKTQSNKSRLNDLSQTPTLKCATEAATLRALSEGKGRGKGEGEGEEEEEEEEEEVEDVECQLCNSRKNAKRMLLCDGCDDGFHMCTSSQKSVP
jgi:hypothetical protein